MRLGQWLATFKALHQKAKTGALPAAEQASYDAARDELARALLAVQRAQTRPGQNPRRALRVSRALQADLVLGDDRVRAITLDLSVGGFGALLARPPAVGAAAKVTLRLPGGELVGGAARVVGVVPQAGNARVAFAFEALGAREQAAIEALVFDTVLEQMNLDAAR